MSAQINAHSQNVDKNWPLHGWFGVLLVIVFWTLNWSLGGLRTSWGFFPLWLGYILTMDAVVYYRKKGDSLLSRNFKQFAGLFLISAPFWWLFELIDMHTQYWIYLGRGQFTDLQYFIFATFSFSTVIPAVLETAEFAGTSCTLKSMKRRGSIGGKRTFRIGLFIAGWLMLIIALWKPQYGTAFVWMSIYCIIDPINYRLGNKSLLYFSKRGDWRPIIALSAGCLMCGFFWEMWNFYSFPKWIYDVPFVDFWHIFEMPLIGFLGYIPFAFDIYVIYHLVKGTFGVDQNYLKLIDQGK